MLGAGAVGPDVPALLPTAPSDDPVTTPSARHMNQAYAQSHRR